MIKTWLQAGPVRQSTGRSVLPAFPVIYKIYKIIHNSRTRHYYTKFTNIYSKLVCKTIYYHEEHEVHKGIFTTAILIYY